MPRVTGVRERITWAWFDRVTLGGSDVRTTLFQTPVGGGSTAKTKVDTNMRSAGQLPSQHKFQIRAIRVNGTPGATAANVIALMKGWLELWVGNTVWYESPLFLLTGGGGHFVSAGVLGTEADAGKANFGAPNGRNLNVLKIPVDIEDQEAFRVDLVWPTAPGALLIRCSLDGILDRPAQ